MLSTDIPPKTHRSAHIDFNSQLFYEQVDRLSIDVLESFKLITRQYALFHIIFFVLGLLELFSFVFFFLFSLNLQYLLLQ